jgi:hypothetical protein
VPALNVFQGKPAVTETQPKYHNADEAVPGGVIRELGYTCLTNRPYSTTIFRVICVLLYDSV